MPDYSKGCIYMLRHKDDIDGKNSYVGSTTNFRQRKNLHKSCCNNINSKKYNYSKYKYIRDNDGWENWVMEWIEDYPCNSKRELERREGEIIKQRAKLNFVVAGRTNKEWRDDNKQILAEKRRIYLQNNKQIIAEKRRIYLQKNKINTMNIKNHIVKTKKIIINIFSIQTFLNNHYNSH